MNTEMHVNTLHIYERLKKAKASESVSREIADIIGNLVTDQLATKNDVLMLQADLKQTEVRLQADLKQTETRLENELKQTELRLQADIAQSKSDTIKWVAGLLLAQAGLITALGKLL